jgi:hypothetical protein
MPANLTPEYERAEQQYREATTDQERLDALQEMLSKIPKHKGTDHMQADLKRRISRLRKDIAKGGPAKGGVDLMHVPKGGAGQVVLVGAPNVGKSALVAACTNATVKVTEYPYATSLPVPGMWPYEDVQIQLVDTPPITPEHIPPGLMGTINSADVTAIVVDLAGPALEQAESVLGIFDAREAVLRSVPRNRLDPANPRERSAVMVATKADLVGPGDVEALGELYGERIEILPVSATTGEGLEALGRRFWELLAVIRVYTKEPGRPADKDKPYTLPVGSTLEDLAREIHRDLPELMKFARIWGDDRLDGQRVHRSEVMQDKDVVEIHQ